jgi:CubicO group peptidase (beta-lactamase class C family)
MMKFLASVLLVSVAVFGAPFASADTGADPLEGLDAAIESAREQWHAPGLAVAIVKDDRVVFAKGYGTRHLGENEPVDSHTVFTLASTSKAFVATSIGMLVDEGKLSWDDPVIRHLPEFKVADPYVTREVTLRDLLSHRTGVEEMDVLWSRGLLPAQALPHMAYGEQATSLRSAWGYNNMMYVAAAEVVARVSGMPFEEFVTQRIFKPLGMTDSLFTGPQLAQRKNVTGAHLVENGRARRTEPYVSRAPLGAAGVQSSAEDMAKWLRMLLNQGKAGDKSIVKAETLGETLQAQIVMPAPMYPAAVQAKPHFFGYGMGWFVQDYKGRLLAMHTGSLYGANALAAIVPEEKLGLVILINAGPVEYRHAFMYDVIDRFIGARGKDWNGDLLELEAKLAQDARQSADEKRKARVSAPPSVRLDAFTGKYSHPLAGDVEVVQRKDGKLAVLMPPDASFTLTHWSYDTFEASDDRAPEETFLLTFQRGTDGKIASYQIENGKQYKRQ